MPLRSNFTTLINTRTLTSTRLCASTLACSLLPTRPRLSLPPQSALVRSMSIVPKTMKVLLINEQGGMESVQEQEVPVPAPQEGEVLIKIAYAGINYIDNYKVGGLYKVNLPFTLGEEAGGTVADVHPSVKSVSVGQKVGVYQSGSYAEYAVAKAEKLAILPEHVDLKSAAGLIVQGLTALTQLRESYAVKKGDWILVHAAAGGVGLNLCQIASHLGAHVIGTASTVEKAELAKKNGAEVVVVGGDAAELKEEVDRLTGGLGVHAIYDGVGKATWDGNWPILRRQGTLVIFGNASGAPPDLPPLKLAGGNWKITRPTLNNAVTTPEEWQKYTKELFDLVDAGVVKLLVSETYPFSADSLREAHKALTGRKTVGKLVLEVSK